MRLQLAFAVLASLCFGASAQQPSIGTYIHHGWNQLSRSMTDCASLTDTKLTTAPILYLPAEEKIPAAVLVLQHQCKVEVRHLPRTIHREAELSPDQISIPGLLYLPNKYVVPGGRFNEMYGWDSYFIILGLLDDGRIDLARGMAENFFYEIEHYGAVLNANRTYYLTRSQPPFLSSIVLDIYRAEFPAHPREAAEFLRRALPYLIKDHALWTTPPHLAGSTGLSRYIDLGHGPVPEMADDSTYYVDVVHWLLAHPAQAPKNYLRAADPSKPVCSANCPKTSAGGFELTESFFSGDRAMRESGFDPSFRFGPFSGSTEDYTPICLNALLYKYEGDLAFIETTLGNTNDSSHWSRLAATRQATINKLMWDDTGGLFFDYDIRKSQRSTYRFITTYYALWTGLATPAQAARLAANLKLFEHPGGLAMSTETTGMQWDAPFGWAPTNWLAIAGLHRYGFNADADRIAREFSATIANNFVRDGTIREKYNVESADANVAVSAGYKTNVIGFGWTNGVYLEMQRLLAASAATRP
jgi:alpha,alpha-trehalase